MSAVTLAELYSGAYRIKSEKGLHEVEFIKTIFQIMPFGVSHQSDYEQFGQNKAILCHSGIPLDDMDLMIGSTAVANSFIMVTHNVRHFSRIPKLKIEDWLA